MADEFRNRYRVAAKIDIGTARENNEDFFSFWELDEDHLLCVMADGSGSHKDHPQPGPLVALEVGEFIQKTYEDRPKLILSDPEYFLRIAMENSNRILGGFKLGNEEIYAGYAASVTCLLLSEGTHLYVAHSGNTRLYLIRDGRLNQLTHDHTRAAELLDEGQIDLETYYAHPDRLRLTSGIGVETEPEIQTLGGKMRQNDLLVLTTDGVHYAIRPEPLAEIILESPDVEVACENIIDAQKSTKYPDNAGIAIIRSTNSI